MVGYIRYGHNHYIYDDASRCFNMSVAVWTCPSLQVSAPAGRVMYKQMSLLRIPPHHPHNMLCLPACSWRRRIRREFVVWWNTSWQTSRPTRSVSSAMHLSAGTSGWCVTFRLISRSNEVRSNLRRRCWKKPRRLFTGLSSVYVLIASGGKVWSLYIRLT